MFTTATSLVLRPFRDHSVNKINEVLERRFQSSWFGYYYFLSVEKQKFKIPSITLNLKATQQATKQLLKSARYVHHMWL